MTGERGITLVELLVYAMLSVVVLVVVGGLLVNSITTQAMVRDSAQAANTAQLAAQSVSRGVRSATELRLDAPAAGSLLLRARVSENPFAGTEHCQAWYYGNGQLRTTISDAAIPVPADETATQGWTLLADDVDPVGADPVMKVNGLIVELAFELGGGDGAGTLVETAVVSRQPPATEEVGSCFS